ncbi:MAG: hypothetical protein HY327_01980, partial [Chloroflexi bacterium]|nr:hypothetical protein [Chloroflexota bacterium]
SLRAYANRVELFERDLFRDELDPALVPLCDMLTQRGNQYVNLGEPELRREIEKAAQRLRLSRFKAELTVVETELTSLQATRHGEGIALSGEDEQLMHERAEYYRQEIVASQRALNALVVFKSRANMAEMV